MSAKNLSNRFVITGLIVTGFLILYTMRFFLDGFLGAVTIYVLARPTMNKLLSKNWKKVTAALLILFATIFVVIIPVFLLVSLVVPKISLLFSSGSLTMEAIQRADERIHALTGFNLLTSENIVKIQNEAASFITNFLGQSLNILTDILLMFLFLYYLLVNIGRNERFLERVIPLTRDKMIRFANELQAQTRSNALGIPLLALAQGIFAVLGYWVFGIPDPLFWGLITGLFSILPMIGSAFIWVPAGIYQLTQGNQWQGIGVILYGIFVIGTVDNVFRLFFQKLFADIHPLITIVGVIVGLQLFGMPGLIFGPLLISYFMLFLRILQEDTSHATDI